MPHSTQDHGNSRYSGGDGYWNTIFIDEVSISPSNCPDCLKHNRFNCEDCAYFDLNFCRLRGDPYYREEIKSLFAYYREHAEGQKKRQQALIKAIRKELESHGRPLHYTLIAEMVRTRHPKLKATDQGVLVLMGYHQDVFESFGEGVFGIRR